MKRTFLGLLAIGIAGFSLSQPVVSVLPDTICIGSTTVLTASVSGGTAPYTYQWSTGSVSDTTVVTPAVTTTYTVTVTDQLSQVGTAAATVTVYASVPAATSPINGNSNPCDGMSLVYSVINSTGVIYYWTVPMGWTITSGYLTNSITVTPSSSSGTVTVTPNNVCGDGPTTSINVTISTGPAQPSPIIGNPFPCPGTQEIYHVTNVPGVAYTWTVPSGYVITSGQGTNTVVVTIGSVAGNVNVTPTNICGNGMPQIIWVDPTCSNVMIQKAGRVFYDDNQNGVKDPGEPPLSGVIIEQLPIPFYFVTNDSGYYNAYIDGGTYSLSMTGFNPYCNTDPPTHTLSGLADTVNDFGVHCGNILDMEIYLIGWINLLHPTSQVWLVIHNSGTSLASGNIWLKYDPARQFDTCSMPYDYHANDSLVWSYSGMLPGQSLAVMVSFDIPSISELGDTLYFAAGVLPIVGDTVPSNNVTNAVPVVVSSYDPNDKQVSAATLTPAQLQTSPNLCYMIRFQNTGNDTAHNIVITDWLDHQVLNVSSFETLASSHTYEFAMDTNGTAIWTFNNIMLPDSNVDLDGSNGWILFQIRSKTNLQLGDTIGNQASIFFDNNPAVITNTAITLIDDLFVGEGDQSEHDEGLFGVYPNPASGVLNVWLTGVDGSVIAELYSISRQCLYTTRSEDVRGFFSLNIETKNYPEGVYFVKVIAGGTAYYRKVVLIR